MKHEDRVLVAKVIVYADEKEQYYSFITEEAYQAIQDWMDFRLSCGEKINGEEVAVSFP